MRLGLQPDGIWQIKFEDKTVSFFDQLCEEYDSNLKVITEERVDELDIKDMKFHVILRMKPRWKRALKDFADIIKSGKVEPGSVPSYVAGEMNDIPVSELRSFYNFVNKHEKTIRNIFNITGDYDISNTKVVKERISKPTTMNEDVFLTDIKNMASNGILNVDVRYNEDGTFTYMFNDFNKQEF